MSVGVEQFNQQFNNESTLVRDILEKMVEQAGRSNNSIQHFELDGSSSSNNVGGPASVEENRDTINLTLELDNSLISINSTDNDCDDANVENCEELNGKVGDDYGDDKLNAASDSADCEIIEVITRKKVKKSASYDLTANAVELLDHNVSNVKSENNINIASTVSSSTVTSSNQTSFQFNTSTAFPTTTPEVTTQNLSLPVTTLVIKPIPSLVTENQPSIISHFAKPTPEIRRTIGGSIPKSLAPSQFTSYSYNSDGSGSFRPILPAFSIQPMNQIYIDNLGNIQKRPMMAHEILKNMALQKQSGSCSMQYVNVLDQNSFKLNGGLKIVTSTARLNDVVREKEGSKIIATTTTTTASQDPNKLTSFADVVFSIGLEFTRLYAYDDQLKYFNKDYKGKDEKEDGLLKLKISRLKENCRTIRTKLAPYNVPTIKCDCGYKTYLNCSLQMHKRSLKYSSGGRIECCLCMKFMTKSHPKFCEHMLLVHKVICRITQPMASFMCNFCQYDGREFKKLLSHMNQCQRRFKLQNNLVIFSDPFDIPLTRRPPKQNILLTASHNSNAFLTLNNISSNDVLTSNANNDDDYITSSSGKSMNSNDNRYLLSGSRFKLPQPCSFANVNSHIGQIPTLTLAQVRDLIRKKKDAMASASSNSPQNMSVKPIFQVNLNKISMNKNKSAIKASINNLLAANKMLNMQLPSNKSGLINSKQKPIKKIIKCLNSNSKIINNLINYNNKAAQIKINNNGNNNNLINLKNGGKSPSKVLSSTIINVKSNTFNAKNKNSNITISGPTCEICNEKIDNLQSLLVHLNVVHKMKIYDINFFLKGKSFVCKTCFEGFWTKPGLEKHEHLAHKVELKFCQLCDSPKNNILGHLASTHNITIQDMYVLRYCYICNCRLTNFEDFSRHMCSNHKDIFPSFTFLQEMVRSNDATFMQNLSQAEQLALQRVVSSSSSSSSSPSKKNKILTTQNSQNISKHTKYKHKCNFCNIRFTWESSYKQHMKQKHIIPCTRCKERFPSQVLANNHFNIVHSSEREPCQICGDLIKIGVAMFRHIRRVHLKKCSVNITRLSGDLKSPTLTQKVKKPSFSTSATFSSPSSSISTSFHLPPCKVAIVPLIDLAACNAGGDNNSNDVTACA